MFQSNDDYYFSGELVNILQNSDDNYTLNELMMKKLEQLDRVHRLIGESYSTNN